MRDAVCLVRLFFLPRGVSRQRCRLRPVAAGEITGVVRIRRSDGAGRHGRGH